MWHLLVRFKTSWIFILTRISIYIIVVDIISINCPISFLMKITLDQNNLQKIKNYFDKMLYQIIN